VYLEVGKKRAFASALEWPGWTRGGKTAEAALEALGAYAERYAAVASAAGLVLPIAADLDVVERIPGGGTTDFGAPEFPATSDRAPLPAAEAERLVGLLAACWLVLDGVAAAAPAELRKGPRGGGRDRDKMYAHVLGAEANYARYLGIRGPEPGVADRPAIARHRTAVVTALRAATGEPDPAQKRWLPRYTVRRMAWHVMDHAWEMEDRY
ncbi:MAG: hypothetical protein M3010_08360, partial [Candidatus Dormibacteraeota bacterium]|nr:hypothetical protein [Candidatus Dormibacteraeota bacterium]